MHVVICFINIGFYHVARLKSAAKACSRHGWRLTALQLTDDTLEHPWGKADDGLGVPMRTLMPKFARQVDSARREGLPVVTQQLIDRQLSDLKPDVIFLPGWAFDVCQKMLHWAAKHNVSVVVMSESKRDDEPRVWWKEKLKYWLYVRKFDGALVGGDAHANYLAELGMSRGKVFKGYDCVDNEHFLRAAEEARSQPDRMRSMYPRMPTRAYFISAFRLMPRKNGLKLIEAYTSYRQSMAGRAWDLVICGSGEQKMALEDEAKKCGVARHVHLVGFLPYHEVGHWYGLAEAFIHPALKEQWGLVINEACAAGLPILCSRTVGAVPDLVHEGINGFLFDARSTQEMARCMVSIQEADEQARRKMGAESLRLVAACAPEAFGKSVIDAAMAARRG